MHKVTLILLVLGMAGCGVELLTTTAIRGELEVQNIKAAQRQVQHVAGQSAKIRIKNAIDTHNAEKGYYPTSLNDLVPGYLPSLPARPDGTQFNYDARTGQLLEGPAPISGGLSDTEKLEQVRKAIIEFGTSTRYYPKSLQDLVPTYLDEIPVTADGRPLIYNPRTGVAYLPKPRGAVPQQMSRQGRAGGYGGGGPMGEAMTGIAMQQELNRSSSAGVNSAGTRSREKIGESSGNYQQRQMDVVEDLGF